MHFFLHYITTTTTTTTTIPRLRNCFLLPSPPSLIIINPTTPPPLLLPISPPLPSHLDLKLLLFIRFRFPVVCVFSCLGCVIAITSRFGFRHRRMAAATTKTCMNSSCKTNTTHEWKKGWPLRSGGYADLCYGCGSAYENSVFCDTFHLEETGWRDCQICNKRLHCGCIASKFLLQLMDQGGVRCTLCAKTSRISTALRTTPMHGDGIPSGFGSLAINHAGSGLVDSRVAGDNVDQRKLTQLCKIMMESAACHLPLQRQRPDATTSFRQEEANYPIGPGPPKFDNADIRDTHDPLSLSQPSLSMSLGAPSGNSNIVPPFSSGEQSRTPSPFQQTQRSRPILPKPSKTGQALNPDTSKSTVSQMRIARPPIEGRGKNHLLPRYWPKITDQELQQLSGDLNSTIVPLFEKILSASDAGRIGRLVLPKACAEAYFPPISQSEGVPLRVQDVKGKEWTFQFRFWPNNNSRMYVLEGVTPCIQSMQLRAGDTVIFSRIDPGGKLVMGFRKSAYPDTQDPQIPSNYNAVLSGEALHSNATENMPSVSGYSGLLQTPKGMNTLSEHLSLTDGNITWNGSDSHGSRINENSMMQPVGSLEKKKSRNIGSKSKRLLMNSEDVLELRITWEEAQGLLRPPPGVNPSIVTIEDHEFEEYEEPPVFGKRTLFTARQSGVQEQWAQCDDCSKWRRLPTDALLPPKWTCADNAWNTSRSSCSAPEEISPKELENLLRVGRDIKKRKTSAESRKIVEEREPSGLDALASAAVLGEKIGESGESSATTKHPRHRPGCSCIVCIQPPSGKGKHKPTCTCNVCLTVKRRFKTLMLRKKKRQSEQESQQNNKDEGEGSQQEVEGGQIDLNCDPSAEPNIMRLLVEAATNPSLLLEQEQSTTPPVVVKEQWEGSSEFVSSSVDIKDEEEVKPPNSHLDTNGLQ